MNAGAPIREDLQIKLNISGFKTSNAFIQGAKQCSMFDFQYL